jgi:hypothetical protein
MFAAVLSPRLSLALCCTTTTTPPRTGGVATQPPRACPRRCMHVRKFDGLADVCSWKMLARASRGESDLIKLAARRKRLGSIASQRERRISRSAGEGTFRPRAFGFRNGIWRARARRWLAKRAFLGQTETFRVLRGCSLIGSIGRHCSRSGRRHGRSPKLFTIYAKRNADTTSAANWLSIRGRYGNVLLLSELYAIV